MKNSKRSSLIMSSLTCGAVAGEELWKNPDGWIQSSDGSNNFFYINIHTRHIQRERPKTQKPVIVDNSSYHPSYIVKNMGYTKLLHLESQSNAKDLAEKIKSNFAKCKDLPKLKDGDELLMEITDTRINIIDPENISTLVSIELEMLIHHSEFKKGDRFGIISRNSENEKFVYLFRTQVKYAKIKDAINLVNKNAKNDLKPKISLRDGTLTKINTLGVKRQATDPFSETQGVKLRQKRLNPIPRHSCTSLLLQTAQKTIEIKTFNDTAFCFLNEGKIDAPFKKTVIDDFISKHFRPDINVLDSENILKIDCDVQSLIFRGYGSGSEHFKINFSEIKAVGFKGDDKEHLYIGKKIDSSKTQLMLMIFKASKPIDELVHKIIDTMKVI